MIAKDRELLARALRGIEKRLKNLEGNQLVLHSEIQVLHTDVKNILLVLQETQAQIRASRGLKLVPTDDEATTPRAGRTRNGNRRN